jgi:hypothetical protein
VLVVDGRGTLAGMADDVWGEGHDGSSPSYHERLHAQVATWIVSTVMILTLGIAFGYVLGAALGLLTFVLAELAAVWVLLKTAATIRIDDRILRAGRARLPLEYVGRSQILDPDATRRARGVDADTRAYLCVRSWLPGSVLVEVTDPSDPHPYWLVSSKDPAGLHTALVKASRVASAERRADAPPLAG